MVVYDLTDVQRQQADEVGRCMRVHVDAIQQAIFQVADKDGHGRVVAIAPLPLSGEELLALQGLITLFTAADDLFRSRG